MNTVIVFLTHIYARLLLFYPRRFRDEFAGEMRVVFKDSLDEAARDGMLGLALVCVREFGGLATYILQEFWHEVERKETVMATNENTRSMIGKEMNHWALKVVAVALAFVTFAWFYTSIQLSSAQTKGIYSSPQQGIQAFVDQMYSADREVKILDAGPYFFNGRQPHLWYVIAEVHATSHADDSSPSAPTKTSREARFYFEKVRVLRDPRPQINNFAYFMKPCEGFVWNMTSS